MDTQTYLNQFNEAKTAHERQDVVDEYKTYYETLSSEDRVRADRVMSVLWPDIERRVNELEPLLEQLNSLLKKIPANVG